MVSPLMRNGSLVMYLKGVEAGCGSIGVGGALNYARGGSVGCAVGLGIGPLPLPSPVPVPEQSPMMGRTRTASFPTWGSPTPGAGESGRRRRSAAAGSVSAVGVVPRELDLYRFMHEIAKGMEYLHENGVLHGDLKVCSVFFLFLCVGVVLIVRL
jgi:hypothetical protein